MTTYTRRTYNCNTNFALLYFLEKGLEFQFKFEASSSSLVGLVAGPGGISWPASEERKVLSVCFWLRTELHTECMSHESEDRKTKYFTYGLNHSSHVFADVQGFRVSRYKITLSIMNEFKRSLHAHILYIMEAAVWQLALVTRINIQLSRVETFQF